MIGKVYKSKKVRVIERNSEDIKVVIATSNHIALDKKGSDKGHIHQDQGHISKE